jgi:hypothetical protein
VKKANIFISWSGEVSKAVAEALYDWLPMVIQSIEPWMSSTDIDKGVRWSSELSRKLESIQVGIICLTRDNLNSKWIHYESGALSKSVNDAYVCPYLFGISESDINGPLSQFQATSFDMSDTKKLITTINTALGEEGIAVDKLEISFNKWWGDLNNRLKGIEAESIDEEKNTLQKIVTANNKDLVDNLTASILEYIDSKINSD